MTGTDRRKEAAMEEMKKQNDELLKSVSDANCDKQSRQHCHHRQYRKDFGIMRLDKPI